MNVSHEGGSYFLIFSILYGILILLISAEVVLFLALCRLEWTLVDWKSVSKPWFKETLVIASDLILGSKKCRFQMLVIDLCATPRIY